MMDTSKSSRRKDSRVSKQKSMAYFFNSDDYSYHMSLVPNDPVLWLASGVFPDQQYATARGTFPFQIPNTLVFGLSPDPIWMHSNDHGQIVRCNGNIPRIFYHFILFLFYAIIFNLFVRIPCYFISKIESEPINTEKIMKIFNGNSTVAFDKQTCKYFSYLLFLCGTAIIINFFC